MTNDSGMVITSHEYLPFGESWITEGDTKNAPKYNSQELDKESGYYFYNARHYDPEIGRFVTPDSVIDGELSTQGWNRYSYVKNNPIVYKDPTGHNAVTDFLGNVASGAKEQATSIKDSVVKGVSDAVNNPKETASRIVSAAGNKIKEYAKEPTKLVTDYGKALAGPLYTGCEKVYNIATAENKGQQLGKELVNTGLEVGLTAAAIGGGKLIGKGLQSLKGAANVADDIPRISIDSGKYPETASHILDAQKSGLPKELTIDRAGAGARRAESLKGIEKVPGKQLDEYPPAMFREGGQGASVRPIAPRDNMGAGASMGNQLRGYKDGAKVILDVK